MNWIYLVAVLVFVCIALMRAADDERVHRMGKVGQRIQSITNHREMRYRTMVAQEVSAAMDKILPRMAYDTREVPDDIVAWLVDVEVENRAVRSFILADTARSHEWVAFFDDWRALNRPEGTF